jgi:hypothetical protein
MSFKLSNFNKPTPEKWEKLGNALLKTSVYLGTGSLLLKYELLALIVLFIGGAGQFLTTFFGDEDVK